MGQAPFFYRRQPGPADSDSTREGKKVFLANFCRRRYSAALIGSVSSSNALRKH